MCSVATKRSKLWNCLPAAKLAYSITSGPWQATSELTEICAESISGGAHTFNEVADREGSTGWHCPGFRCQFWLPQPPHRSDSPAELPDRPALHRRDSLALPEFGRAEPSQVPHSRRSGSPHDLRAVPL